MFNLIFLTIKLHAFQIHKRIEHHLLMLTICKGLPFDEEILLVLARLGWKYLYHILYRVKPARHREHHEPGTHSERWIFQDGTDHQSGLKGVMRLKSLQFTTETPVRKDGLQQTGRVILVLISSVQWKTWHISANWQADATKWIRGNSQRLITIPHLPYLHPWDRNS